LNDEAITNRGSLPLKRTTFQSEGAPLTPTEATKKLENKELNTMRAKIDKGQVINFEKEKKILLRSLTFFVFGILMFIIFSYFRHKRRRRLLSEKNLLIENQRNELKQSFLELRRAQSQLIQYEKMASLGQAMAGIAHEINNPLNFVSGGVQALSNSFEELRHIVINPEQNQFQKIEEINEEITSLLKTINNGALRAHKIVSGLRTFSSPQESDRVNFDLSELVENMISLFSSKLKEDKVTLITSFPEVPHNIKGSPTQISQVVFNILDNAIYSMKECPVRKLTISLADEHGFVVLKIKDMGTGIRETILEKIFDPFFTTKPIGEGTGLGLSISYRIIQEHAGFISFETSTLGTTFSIRLPKSI
jgi:C4-dicarboxylate-specific signal transduction histidine kinase